jgi:RNA polymerase sigma factor (sigma-70 family)
MANLSPALQRAIRRAVRRLQPSCPPPNWNNADWRDELLHEAILAGLEAERDFDASQGVSLESFAYHRICAHLKTFCNREWRYQRAVVAFPNDEETGEVWEPEDEQSEEAYRQVEARMVVEYLRGQLEEWEYQLWSWVGQGRSYRWIGEQLGISHTMARKRWRQLQAKLQALMGNSSEKSGF